MSLGQAKVYFDGSHYIAIPHTTRNIKKRPPKVEETITVMQEEQTNSDDIEIQSIKDQILNDSQDIDETPEDNEIIEKNAKETHKIEKQMTKKEFFEELYIKYFNENRRNRKKKIIEEMLPYFEDYEKCKNYVDLNFDRKIRNLICKRVRMTRKANLANFNYFCTFTYDDKLHTEQTFRKTLRICLMNLCKRKKWRYMAVWERAPESNRLHFHGLFFIPDNSIPGIVFEKRDYDTRAHEMRTTHPSSYFIERFGRNNFDEIESCERKLGNALAYLMKYIEKSNEKIVYSKGLPQYFISDIMDDDVVCLLNGDRIEKEKYFVPKYLLFDNFKCFDEGVYIGNVSPEVIEQMPKCN